MAETIQRRALNAPLSSVQDAMRQLGIYVLDRIEGDPGSWNPVQRSDCELSVPDGISCNRSDKKTYLSKKKP